MRRLLTSAASPLLATITTLLSTPAATRADVVGYWRFENESGFFSDSGPNGLGLTGNANPPSVSISGTFPNPVPATGAPNLQAADFDLASTQAFSIDDNPAFAVQDFTIEAFINAETAGAGTTGRSIVSQIGSSNTNLAWRLLMTGTGSGLGARNLVMQLSSGGTGATNVNFDSDFQLELGINYYVAASVDFTAGVNTSVTFYLQNLSAGTPLQSFQRTSTAISSLFDSTNAFRIGAAANPATDYFDGLIDEVRFSNTALDPSSLLLVPEPGAATLLLTGLLALGARRRNHQA